jgi:hypothetical protein
MRNKVRWSDRNESTLWRLKNHYSLFSNKEWNETDAKNYEQGKRISFKKGTK